jgi:4-amino-4-deoxy-L-arabinose transferase-like glycosyltransferase
LSVVKTLHSQDFIALGLTLGLGFLTKGTFYVYAPPLMIWFFFSRLKQVGVRKLVMETMLLTIIAVTLNAPFWVRNIQTYGGPYGTSDWLRENLTIDEISFLMHGSTAYAASPSDDLPSPKSPPSDDVGGAALIYESTVRLVEQGHARRTESFVGDRVNSLLKRVLRTAGFNFVTPSYAINSTILKVFERFPAVFDEEYISSWNQVAWSHEDTAPNTLHFVLILLSFPVMMWIWYKDGQRLPGIYTLVIATTFLLIPLIIGHGASIWGMRYQLPFFVLWAPVFGVVASRLRPPGISVFLGGLLLVGAIPWLLFNNTRPLIGRVPWPTRVGSIINTPTAEIMFAINPALMPSYIEATDVIQASSCKRIGLRIDSDDLEYLFWWLLEAPQSGIQIESVFTYAHLESLIDWEFEPCAILCTICGNRTRLHGLPLTGDFSRVNLFAGDGFTLDIDG